MKEQIRYFKPEELQLSEQYKFVKANGQYYFFHTYWSHVDVVSPDDKLESAGMIGINFDNEWSVLDNSSMTLKIGFNAQTEDELSVVLGRTRRRNMFGE